MFSLTVKKRFFFLQAKKSWDGWVRGYGESILIKSKLQWPECMGVPQVIWLIITYYLFMFLYAPLKLYTWVVLSVVLSNQNLGVLEFWDKKLFYMHVEREEMQT